jgi:hypothetical protein
MVNTFKGRLQARAAFVEPGSKKGMSENHPSLRRGPKCFLLTSPFIEPAVFEQTLERDKVFPRELNSIV